MPAYRYLRKRYFVDRKVQGALALRMVLYWITCALTMTLVMFGWSIVTRPVDVLYSPGNGAWFHFGPAIFGSLLLLPIVVCDVIRLSNRFAGPLVRLRRAMRELAEGRRVPPIRFRDGDFWQDFADDFNLLSERVQGMPPRGEADAAPCEKGAALLDDIAALHEEIAAMPLPSPAQEANAADADPVVDQALVAAR